MQSDVIKEEILPRATGLPADENGGRRWHAPVLSVFEMSGAQADVTSNDDGLGDGQFSNAG